MNPANQVMASHKVYQAAFTPSQPNSSRPDLIYQFNHPLELAASNHPGTAPTDEKRKPTPQRYWVHKTTTSRNLKLLMATSATTSRPSSPYSLSTSFLVQFVILKNAFTFGRWCHYALTVIVSWCYVITQEWWFRVHFIHAEDFSLSTKSNFMHIALWPNGDSALAILIFTFPSVSVIYFSLVLSFSCVTAPNHFWQTSYIILQKDVICWPMGPLRWVVGKKESSWSKFVHVAIWLPLGHWILGLLGKSPGRCRSAMGSCTLWACSWFIRPSFDLHFPVGKLHRLHQRALWIRNPRKLLNSLLQSHVVAKYILKSFPFELVWLVIKDW